jgi:hypothetical protein
VVGVFEAFEAMLAAAVSAIVLGTFALVILAFAPRSAGVGSRPSVSARGGPEPQVAMR